MKKLSGVITLSLALALAFAAPALAGHAQMSSDFTGMSGMSQFSGHDYFRISNLFGKEVKTESGHDLGKVEDVVVDPSRAFNYVIISPAGETDNKLVPIPWQAIRRAPSGDFLVANLDWNSFTNAPSFSRNDWPSLTGPRWEQAVSSYYGFNTYPRAWSHGTYSYLPSEQEGSGQQMFRGYDREMGATTETYSFPRYTMREYLGKPIWNDRGEQVGTVDNFVFDPGSGKISYAIVGIGEGDRETTVPWSAFDVNRGNLFLHVNKDRFASAPSFPRDRYPNFANEDWNNRMRSYYGEPQFYEGGRRAQ